MKAEFDKEIDSLLRESARRGRAASGAGVAAGGGAPDVAATTAHLDADEQSAYAENALPAPARAHYTVHLADCDDCRRGVTRLALAAGMPAQVESRETAAAAAEIGSTNVTWRERLGALLAPRAWRYAVPALALLLVGSVTLIVLTRRSSEMGSVARRAPADSERQSQKARTEQMQEHHAPQNDNADPAATNGAGVLNRTPSSNAPGQNIPQSNEEIAAGSARPEAAQPSAGAAVNYPNIPPPPAATSSGGGAAGVGSTSARAVSELPAPTPAPLTDSVTVTSDEAAKVQSGERAAELRKLEQKPGNADNRRYENRQREQISGPRRNEQAQNARAAERDDSRDRADKKDGNLAATTAPPAAAPATRRSRQQRAPAPGENENRAAEDSEGVEAPKSAAETRTVAGRKFRRQGNAWVDAAYRAGQSYTVVRRNSEQFRALVADEPELRRIGDAFGGDVTVVWKGRAYRIK